MFKTINCLLLLLVFSLSFTFCTGNVSDNKVMSNIPDWAKLVLTVDVNSLIKNEQIMKEINTNKDNDINKLIESAKKNNINVEKDINAIFISVGEIKDFNALKNAGKDIKSILEKMDVMIVVSGTFKKENVSGFMKEYLKSSGKINEETISETPVLTETETNFSVCLLDNKIVGCKKDKVKESIDFAKGKGKDVSSSPDMAKIITPMASKKPFWLAIQATPALKELIKASGGSEVMDFDKISSAGLYVDYDKKADIGLNVICADKDSASTVKTKFDGYSMLLGMGLGMVGLSDKKLNIALEDTMIKVNLELNEKDIKTLEESKNKTLQGPKDDPLQEPKEKDKKDGSPTDY